MLTKNDLKLIRLLMKEMSNELREEIKSVHTDIKKDIQSIRSEMAYFKKEVKNDIVTFKDEIIGEIRNSHIDSEVIRSYKDTLENHEERIVKLEKVSSN